MRQVCDQKCDRSVEVDLLDDAAGQAGARTGDLNASELARRRSVGAAVIDPAWA
ncbi:hypothetical protein [Actinomadura oligospora]|uniref:hypothetical protein n=1 Tax=Actinomadura oligospora TaxID=111804 RepID=UPI0004B2BE61|nr:hypothetical protein [Actinomadura oligospora]